MPTAIIAQDFAFFCDEAGISNDRYTVVGGLCMRKDRVKEVLINMRAYRELHNMHKELKWTKITNQKTKEYLALVDYFFAMNNANQCHFHCIIFDNHRWRHSKYNDGDSDVGLSKLYYQILHHKFCKLCGPHGTLYVRMDHRNSSTSLHDLRRMLNAAAARDHAIATNPFKVIEPADSKQCDILQINDVLLGAVCSVRNGKNILETTREAKRQIGSLVLEKSGLNSFEGSSPTNNRRFSVWNMISRE